MAVQPSIFVAFLDGLLAQQISTVDQVCLKLACATGGPYLSPVRAGNLSDVLRFRHGPLVRSGAFHTDNSGSCYLMRCRSSVPGAIGAATKSPSQTNLASLGALTLSLATYTPHAPVVGGSGATAWNLAAASGWQAAGAPLPLAVTSAGGTAAHTQTVTGVDTAGNTVVEVLTIGGAGTVTSTTDWAQVLKVVASVDPAASQSYAQTWLGPGDRYACLLTVQAGGVLGVTGGTTPTYTLSYDGGVTQSRAYSMPSSGAIELMTYAGGLTPQSTGQVATLSAGSLGQTVYGAIKLAGATEDGDAVLSLIQAGVTASVVVSGNNTPLSIAVSSSAIAVHPATDGGGVVTTTGAALVTFYQTSGSGGAVSARALATISGVGTGAGLLAAQGSTAATNGGVTATPLVEGASLRLVNQGTGKTHSVGVVGRAVTLNVDTDAKGEVTTTATQAAGYLNAHAVASTLLSAAATGDGTGLVGHLGTYLALPVSLATGDSFSWVTTPPAWSDADLQEATSALLANTQYMSLFSVLHVVGESEDVADNVLATFVAGAAAQQYDYVSVVAETYHMADAAFGAGVGAAAESTWLASLLSTYATKSTSYGLAAGEVNCLNSAYGTVDRLNFGTDYVARLMICPISELPSHVECDTVLGTKYALDGTLVRNLSPGDQPLWQSDSTLQVLNSNNFITARTHAGRSGVYVRQGLEFTVDGSDYTYVTNRRCANVAAKLLYNEALRFLNSNQLVDPKTGQLAEAACQKFESQFNSVARAKLVGNDDGRQHLSSFSFTVDRGTNFVQTGQVSGFADMVPRIPATSISIRLGFSPTITGQQ